VTPVSGHFFHKLYSGPGSEKTQNPARVDSGTPDSWPPVPYTAEMSA